jgi:hypothetical protein
MASCWGGTATESHNLQVEDLYLKSKNPENNGFKRTKSFVLSRQMPPMGSSPPSPPQGDFVQNYLMHLLDNNRLSIDQEMYKEYNN